MSVARDILNEARTLGVTVYLSNGVVRASYKGEPSASFMQKLRAAKQDIHAELSSGPRNPPPGYVHRFCETCGTFPAPFGIGVFPLAKEEGRWFCAKCRPMKGK